MTEPHRSRTFSPHVEYGLFLVRDEDDYDSQPPEDIGIACLPVARGVVYVASTIQEHQTKAQVCVWPGAPPKGAEGELLGQVTLFSKSGRISVHSMTGGPEEQWLELQGPGLYGQDHSCAADAGQHVGSHGAEGARRRHFLWHR